MRLQVGQIELSQFGPADFRELYRIRNHPSVRRHVSNRNLISYGSHLRWCRANLIDNAELLLFLTRRKAGERAIGLTQLRLKGVEAEIGVMFREPTLQQAVVAIATVATLHLAFDHLHLQSLTSHVLPSHAAAVKFNKSFGAWEESSEVPGMLKLRLTSDACRNNQIYHRILCRIKARLRVIED